MMPEIRLDPHEEEMAREFVRGRHSQEEWDAFFRYVQMPRWKRILSQVVGALADALLPR